MSIVKPNLGDPNLTVLITHLEDCHEKPRSVYILSSLRNKGFTWLYKTKGDFPTRRDPCIDDTWVYLVIGAESVYTAELEENFGPITLRHTSARL